MKKETSILMALILAVVMTAALSACSGKTAEAPTGADSAPAADSLLPTVDGSQQVPTDDRQQAASEGTSADADTKTLVVYFSVPDNRDNSYVEVNGQRLGNTQYMAYVIQENTGADIFRILPKTPYPTDHDELLQVAQEEIRQNARPEIDGTIENFDSYDTVFVGYPNWNADMPHILYTFFETYDFSGKTIVPFNTHGGSGFSNTQATIAKLQPGAAMLEGKSISRNSIEGAEQEIIDWLQSIGMLKTDR